VAPKLSASDDTLEWIATHLRLPAFFGAMTRQPVSTVDDQFVRGAGADGTEVKDAFRKPYSVCSTDLR